MAIERQSAERSPVVEKKTTWQSEIKLRRQEVSGRDRMFFTERLALLLETGNTLQPSLLSLQQQTSNPALARVIASLSDEVLAGRTFSQALAKHPQVFSPTYVNLIGASEHGGFMHQVLKQLQEMEEKRDKLRSTIVSAFSYPVFLLLFSSGVIFFILTVVFPKFGSLFQAIYDDLPVTTRFLMTLSNMLRNYWLVLIIALVLGGFAARRWLQSPSGQELFDRLKLKLPLIRDVFVQLYLILVLRVLSLSLSNGVNIIDALNASQEVVNNRVFRRFMAKVEQQVSEGQGLASGFESGAFIPDMVQQMIRTGEESGNLALVMGRVADFYERELEKRVALLAKVVEPLMLLLMGIVVGVIVASLILPIFKLSRVVH